MTPTPRSLKAQFTTPLLKLLWEQKTNSGIHDVSNTYDWSDSGEKPDGMLFTDFLYRLNKDVSPNGDNSLGCFVNFCDWRLPTDEELKGIVDSSRMNPSIDPIFGPTMPFGYWSATTLANAPAFAWGVNFMNGRAGLIKKTSRFHLARAVRSGL